MRILAAVMLAGLILCSLMSAPLGSNVWQPASVDALLGTDEFGRDLLMVLLISIGRSLVLGLSLAATAIILATLLAIGAANDGSGRARWLVSGLSAMVESVPILIWVLLGYTAVTGGAYVVAGIVFVLAVLPFLTTIITGEFERLGREPFVEAAKVAAVSPFRIAGRHILPNSADVLFPVFVQIVGLAMAIPGAVGVLGFTNRSRLDIGVLLFRGKENVAVHPVLLISSVLGLLFVYLCLWALRAPRDRDLPSRGGAWPSMLQ